MSQTITVQNAFSSLIESGKDFQSLETPLVYCDGISNNSVNVTVIAPFHNNVYPDGAPTITASVGTDGNDVLIIPSYNKSIPLSSTYTQVVKISFSLSTGLNIVNNQAVINVTVDEEGQPDDNAVRFGDPRRKTKVIANGG
ncbi:MAG: hypothetical protein ED556_11600 [Winogradskyella sp.]|uniref:hypothetical protein n=1 Tax=Winogradskyella sp. TaxID=1883156 RepID=UPI000F3B7CD3|nr:hypothetical protein [Winogradskyella sp.]RNC84100.1 MAG: hypothetical protein ED556_11600 [Winogradskyella sp.]